MLILLEKISQHYFVSVRLFALIAAVSIGLFCGSVPQAFAESAATNVLNPGTDVVSTNSEGTDALEHVLEEKSLPKAKKVELDDPVIDLEAAERAQVPVDKPSPTVDNEVPVERSNSAIAQEKTPAVPMIILGTEVPPATATRLSWTPSQSLEGISSPTPILIVNGSKPGPVLCLTAALHGDELNGIEIVRRVLYKLEAESLAGSVIGVPIVNLEGFRRTSRYLTDRRDLNRAFPGNPNGSSASRIAYSFFTEVISHCDALVDLHTGSFHRTNLPQLRADITKPAVVALTQGFGSTVVLQSSGGIGTLRRAAVDAGIPAVTLEAGESMRLQEDAVEHGVKGIRTLMHKLGMLKKRSRWGDPEPVYYNSTWVRADLGGILFRKVELGDNVRTGDLLGVVTDPITNIRNEIVAAHDGQVIGMAVNQVVLPGFAAFHIGIKASEALIPDPESIVGSEEDALNDFSGVNTDGDLESTLSPDDNSRLVNVVADSNQETVMPTNETADVAPGDVREDTDQEAIEDTQSEVDNYD
ncbi:MAG: putative deacylase [Halioglobus sp.]